MKNDLFHERAKQPKIITPVRRVDDIIPLINAGAGEFYGGYVDKELQDLAGNYIEINRRSSYGAKANFESIEDLCEAVRICRANGVDFHLALNAPQIPEQYFRFLDVALEKYREAGGQYVILSDPALLELVKSYKLFPTISSCTDVINAAGVAFFYSLGCKRIIFPRDVSLQDIQTITNSMPSLEYEAFLMNGGCRYHDGCCFCIHGTKERGLCDTLDYTRYTVCGKSKNNSEENHLRFKELFFRSCGQCALYDLVRLVDSVKIVGRNANLESILHDIAMTKENIRIAMKCSCQREYLSQMQKPVDAEIRCKSHRNCYYDIK